MFDRLDRSKNVQSFDFFFSYLKTIEAHTVTQRHTYKGAETVTHLDILTVAQKDTTDEQNESETEVHRHTQIPLHIDKSQNTHTDT